MILDGLGVGREEAEWIQPFRCFQKRRQPDPREACGLWNLGKDLRPEVTMQELGIPAG